jgi:hypothetical protein
MRVPLAVVMDLRHDDKIRLCDNCQRYLCLVEDTAEDNVEPATGKTVVKKIRKQLAHAL